MTAVGLAIGHAERATSGEGAHWSLIADTERRTRAAHPGLAFASLRQNGPVRAGRDRVEAVHESTGGPKRILVYGVTGSGKTTLARQISETTGLPFHSADDEIGWLPGWAERPRDEQCDLALRIASSEQWVLDTAYGHWRELVVPRAELIVALDYPRLVSLFRLLRRTTRRVITRELACNGNRESLRMVVSSESIVAWHFRSFSRKRERIAAWEADPHAPPVLRLRSPRMTEEWLAVLRKAHADSSSPLPN